MAVLGSGNSVVACLGASATGARGSYDLIVGAAIFIVEYASVVHWV
jgi:hypothetical protein